MTEWDELSNLGDIFLVKDQNKQGVRNWNPIKLEVYKVLEYIPASDLSQMHKGS